MKFKSGLVVATPRALEILDSMEIAIALGRHFAGDWGDICEEDKELNDDAVEHGGRILSSYTYAEITFWIITEADRSVTTILLPDEY